MLFCRVGITVCACTFVTCSLIKKDQSDQSINIENEQYTEEMQFRSTNPELQLESVM